MQIVIQIPMHMMAHMKSQQMGAFVAHCYTLKDLSYVKVSKNGDYISAEIAFKLPDVAQLVDSAKLEAQLRDALTTFANMEPYPCNCGCGAFISVSPCLRQSGELVENSDPQLNEHEKNLLKQGNKIGAVKSLRERCGKIRKSEVDGSPVIMGLRECVDICNAYIQTLDAAQQLNAASAANYNASFVPGKNKTT
jgi:hypothetical protein